MSKSPTPKYKKDLAEVIDQTKSLEHCLFLLKELDERTESAIQNLKRTKFENPYWYYEPSDGIVTEDGMKVLKKYLREEDIPTGRLDGQKDVHLSTATIRGASGGNQSGKSTTGCMDCYIDGTGLVPPSLQGIYPKEKLPDMFPRLFRYITVDHTTLLNTVLPTFRYWAPKEFLVDGDWDKSYREEGKEGQRLLQLGKKGKLFCAIEFMTNEMKVAKFQGPPRHKMVYDEEPRQDIYKENLMRFITADRLDILFCWTPTNGLSWATDMFQECIDDVGREIELFKLCSVTNKRANMETLTKLLDGIADYDELKMRLLGEFISLSGLVYGKLFNPRIHVVQPFEITKDYLVLLGIDPHLVTPTAAVFLAVDREKNLYVVDSFFKEGDTEEVKRQINSIFAQNNWRWGWSVADKSANSDIIAFGGRNIFRELGKPPFPLKALRESSKFEGSIKAGVDEIKRALKIREIKNAEGQVIHQKPQLFIFNTPNNKPLIHAFKTLERETYTNEDVQGMKDKIKEGKFHLHAALRYLFQFPINWYPEMDQVPQPLFYDEGACW